MSGVCLFYDETNLQRLRILISRCVVIRMRLVLNVPNAVGTRFNGAFRLQSQSNATNKSHFLTKYKECKILSSCKNRKILARISPGKGQRIVGANFQPSKTTRMDRWDDVAKIGKNSSSFVKCAQDLQQMYNTESAQENKAPFLLP